MKRIATTLLVAGLMAAPVLALPPTAAAAVSIGIGLSVGIPPPALPVYVQPVAPAPGYIWTPGYWAWNPAYGYYWVPGTWVLPPAIGLLWTPGWWGWSEGYYRWHPGYWGRHVGFYGGINYGFGYFGVGYVGGYWRGRDFYYNRAVNNVNVTNIRNVYVNKTVINNVHVTRVSYNGGRGGIMARPTRAQLSYANDRRIQPTPVQLRQRDVAMRDPAQRFRNNRGRPAVFATQHPGDFRGTHAVRAATAANGRMVAAPERARQATDAAPHEHMVRAPGRGNRDMRDAPRDRAQTPRTSNWSPRGDRAAAARAEQERGIRREEQPRMNPAHEPQPRGEPHGRPESRGQRRDKPRSSGGHW